MVIRRQRTSNSSSGFTLIELLIVIIVIGVLSAIVLLAVGSASSTANLTACKADVQTVASALQGWRSDYGGYTLPGTNTNVTLDKLVAEGYLSSQLQSDPQKSYTVSLVFSGAGAQVRVQGNSGTGTGSFDVDSASASANTECKKALGL